MPEKTLLETGLQALGLLGAGVGWLYQVRATVLRGKIKSDLEILEKSRTLFGVDDERCRLIEKRATKLMSYLYRHPGAQSRISIGWNHIALGIVCLIGAGAFMWGGVFGKSDLGLWQIGPAALLAFVSFGAFLNAYDAHRRV